MRIGIELDIGVRKLEIDPEYGYLSSKFVEYALRLQAQRERRLSVNSTKMPNCVQRIILLFSQVAIIPQTVYNEECVKKKER